MYSLPKPNVMNLFFLHPAAKNGNNQPDKHTSVQPHEPPHNTIEGSEFLDDAIRMEDLPVTYTEQSIAAGSPKNLL
jgi:hypothetical protein